MHNAIVDKLRKHLAGPMDTEADAVYLMCETRKLLDYADPSRTPTPLRMFCHWALHVELSGRGTTQPFVQRVDDVVTNLFYGSTTAATFAAEDELFRELGFFVTFRDELRAFLAGHQLPTDLCDDDARWFTFLEAYAGVIEDGSLLCKLKTVEGVTFTKERSTLGGSVMPFAAKWVVSLQTPYKGCSKLDIEVQGNGHLTSSGYHLR